MSHCLLLRYDKYVYVFVCLYVACFWFLVSVLSFSCTIQIIPSFNARLHIIEPNVSVYECVCVSHLYKEVTDFLWIVHLLHMNPVAMWSI